MTREKLVEFGAQRLDWDGFEGWQMELAGCNFRIVVPRVWAQGQPWFWRPEFFGAFADTDRMLLDRGWALVFLDLPNHYGCPVAVDKFAQMHLFVSEELHGASKMAVLALSRAGLSAYNFASAHPDKVCAIYADNPVCDFRSWPGGTGVGPGSPGDWERLLQVYELTDAAARSYERQPLSKEVLKPLSDAKIPVMHVCGDADEVVPFEENSACLGPTFEALGGSYQQIMVPGGKHHPHGLPDPTPVVEFLESAFTSSTN